MFGKSGDSLGNGKCGAEFALSKITPIPNPWYYRQIAPILGHHINLLQYNTVDLIAQ